MPRIARRLTLSFALILAISALSPVAAEPTPGRSLYLVGDSITAGVGVPSGDQWRDSYPVRVRDNVCGWTCEDIHVVGHGGQCLVFTGCGYGATLLSTFRTEVLEATPKPTEVIVLIGINDLAHVSDYDLQLGYQKLFNMAAGAGVDMYYGTLLPTGPALGWRGVVEAQRLRINAWLKWSWPTRTIDYAAPLTGGNGMIWPEYDSGDGLHPNWRGTIRMADMVLGKGL